MIFLRETEVKNFQSAKRRGLKGTWSEAHLDLKKEKKSTDINGI